MRTRHDVLLLSIFLVQLRLCGGEAEAEIPRLKPGKDGVPALVKALIDKDDLVRQNAAKE